MGKKNLMREKNHNFLFFIFSDNEKKVMWGAIYNMEKKKKKTKTLFFIYFLRMRKNNGKQFAPFCIR
jgi:hypothetical protein